MKHLAALVLALCLVVPVRAESTVRVTVIVWGVSADGSNLKPLYGAVVSIFGRATTTGAYGVAEIDVPEQHGEGIAYAAFSGFPTRTFPIPAGGEKAGATFFFPLVLEDR